MNSPWLCKEKVLFNFKPWLLYLSINKGSVCVEKRERMTELSEDIRAEKMHYLRQLVVDFSLLSEQIGDKMAQVKKLKLRQKELERNIGKFMEDNNIGGYDLAVKRRRLTRQNWRIGFENLCKIRGLNGLSFEELEREVETTRKEKRTNKLERRK